MSPYREGLFDLRPGPIMSQVAHEGSWQGRIGTDAQGTLPQGGLCRRADFAAGRALPAAPSAPALPRGMSGTH